MPDPDEPRLWAVQNVTSTGGFAYGVIGADIHVFANGLPLYLLANWQPTSNTDQNWLRELPSRMLNAHRAVVPFTGRDEDLAQLRSWRDGGQRLAVRWLYGPGGQGKTRLATQFAADSARAGWKVIVAFHGPDADPPAPGSQDMRLDGAEGLLVIVDYADRWRLTNLTWLLKNTLLHQPSVATRVLMVARTADSWPAIRSILDTHQAGASSQHLPALSNESGEQGSMFTAALNSFAAVYRLPDVGAIRWPGSLDDPEFGLTLAVHMAALVAVDAHAAGHRAPSDAGGLSMYLLDREHLHWARLYADGTAAAESAGSTYQTTPEVMNQTVFAAALSGTVSLPVGTRLLENMQLPNPSQVLKDHTICYPPAVPVREVVLEPIYPDRLAEDFLALTLPGHLADYPAQAWAASTADTLLARYVDRPDPAAWTPRAITFLASAAARWPHVAQTYLCPLLLRDPQVAIDASAALTALAGTEHVTTETLEAIEPLLPSDRHVDLDVGAAALYQRLAEHRLSHTDDPELRAHIYDRLRSRLSNAGLKEKAADAAEEAVALHRHLASENPAAFELELGVALNDLGAVLQDLGRWHEARTAVEEALEIYQRYAAQDYYQPGGPGLGPVLISGYIGMGFSNLSAILTHLGRWDDALAAAEKASETLDRLASDRPAVFGSSLATALNNLGMTLDGVGRPAQAAEAAQRAVEVLRSLAGADPARFEPDLAAALNNLSADLERLGRAPEALAASTEAVDIRRRLAQTNPAAFEGDLARALNNLGMMLNTAGEYEDALVATEEAIAIYRRLAPASPATFEPALTKALNNLSGDLDSLGRAPEALAASTEAVDIGRRLARDNPAASEQDLAELLGNMAVIAARDSVGQMEQAIACWEEAIDIYTQLARNGQHLVRRDLAHTWILLGTAKSRQGQHGEAMINTSVGTEMLRRLAAIDPAAFERDLAWALRAHVKALLASPGKLSPGGFPNALAAAEESVALHARLSEEGNQRDLDIQFLLAVSALADVLDRLGRSDEAQRYRKLPAGKDQLEASEDAALGRTRSLATSLSYGFAHAFTDAERKQLAVLHLFRDTVGVLLLSCMGNPEITGEDMVPELAGLDGDTGIALLDRAVEIGLLTSRGGGYFKIHPALPWYFTTLFTATYGQPADPAARRVAHAYARAFGELGYYYLSEFSASGADQLIDELWAEEANLLHALDQARGEGLWNAAVGCLQGLSVLYGRTGRDSEWARLVAVITSDVTDPATDGPLPGQEQQWSIVTSYRVSLARHARDWPTATELLNAVIAWDRDQAAEALAAPPSSLTLVQSNQIRSLGADLCELGTILLLQDDPGCLLPYQEALALQQKVGDRLPEGVAAACLGNAYLLVSELRDLDQAEHWWRRSLNLRPDSDLLGRGECLNSLGRIAMERFRDGLAAGQAQPTLVEQLEAALRSYRQSLDLTPADDHENRAIIENQLGNVLARAEDVGQALCHYQRAVQHDEARGDIYGAGQARHNIAIVLDGEGRVGDALHYARAALDNFEQVGPGAAADADRERRYIADLESS